MTSPALERLRAARAAKSATPQTELEKATIARDNAEAQVSEAVENIRAVAEAKALEAAGAINPPGEACEPPPDPKVVKAAEKALEAEVKAATKALKKPKATKSASDVIESKSPSDVTVPGSGLRAALEADPSAKLAILYVDCFPVKRVSDELELVDASELIEAASDIVSGELDVPHYSLVDFGKGRGALHVALKHIVATRPGPFNVLLSTRSSAGNDALQALSEAALVVVRGAA